MSDQKSRYRALLKNSALKDYRIEVVYYRGSAIDKYYSLPMFLWYEVIGWRIAEEWADGMRAQILDHRISHRVSRIRVLGLVVSIFLGPSNGSRSPVSIEQIVDAIQKRRWANHPRWDFARDYVRLVLRGLQETGDVEVVQLYGGLLGERYKRGPQALSTLAQYEVDERRHRYLLFTQVILAILTGIIAYTSFFGS